MSARTDRYPFGKFPLPPEYPWFEPLTMLAAIAGATSRIRLATGVLISPLRPAVLLAKIAATLDVVSGGRLDLGVGTGWQREEYEASGIPFAGRAARMDDQLRACRVLWSDAPARSSPRRCASRASGRTPSPCSRRCRSGSESHRRRRTRPGSPSSVRDGCRSTPTPRSFARASTSCAARSRRRGAIPPSCACERTTPVGFGAKGVGDLDAALTAVDAARAAGATDIEFMAGNFVRRPDALPAFLERIGKLSEV